MKYWFIVNPMAGKGKFVKKIYSNIRAFSETTDIPCKISLTKCRGDATRIAREICQKYANEEKVIFACGGDGMVSEVASGIAGYDAVALGVIASGTGNDFVRSFTNSDAFTAIEKQGAGRIVPIDAIHYYNDDGTLDRYSVNVLNMGFDCYVVECADRAKQIPLVESSLAYMVGVAMAAVKKPGLIGEISIDGGEFRPFDLMFLLAANGSYYGGGYCPAPKAIMQDGKLDVCMIQNVTRRTLIKLIDSYRKGTFCEQPEVIEKNLAEQHLCERLTVRFPEPTAVCGDGEIHKTEIVHAEVKPSYIRFFMPEPCDFRTPMPAPEAEKSEELASV